MNLENLLHLTPSLNIHTTVLMRSIVVMLERIIFYGLQRKCGYECCLSEASSLVGYWSKVTDIIHLGLFLDCLIMKIKTLRSL